MACRVFMQFIFALEVFHEGQTALIQTQRVVMAAVGDEALLSCQLTKAKEVLQVTWQKSEREKNVASYTKQFGERVNVDFRDKVKFKDAGLQSSSIIIRDVTEKDEGCYKCLFNTYPEGALITTTCLKLCELHEPVLHVTESNSPEETLVSCSVTGRPAPTVTLRVLRQDLNFSHYISDSVTNTNGTVTVTTTAVLSGFHDSSTQVGCAVQVPSGPQIERFMMIPEVKQTSADGFDERSESNNDFNVTWIIMCVSVVPFCCIAAIIAVLQQKLGNRVPHKDSEEKKKTPYESGSLRLWISPGKNEKGDDQKASSPTARPQTALMSEKIRELTPEKNEESDNLKCLFPALRFNFDQSEQFCDTE